MYPNSYPCDRTASLCTRCVYLLHPSPQHLCMQICPLAPEIPAMYVRACQIAPRCALRRPQQEVVVGYSNDISRSLPRAGRWWWSAPLRFRPPSPTFPPPIVVWSGCAYIEPISIYRPVNLAVRSWGEKGRGEGWGGGAGGLTSESPSETKCRVICAEYIGFFFFPVTS